MAEDQDSCRKAMNDLVSAAERYMQVCGEDGVEAMIAADQALQDAIRAARTIGCL